MAVSGKLGFCSAYEADSTLNSRCLNWETGYNVFISECVNLAPKLQLRLNEFKGNMSGLYDGPMRIFMPQKQ